MLVFAVIGFYSKFREESTFEKYGVKTRGYIYKTFVKHKARRVGYQYYVNGILFEGVVINKKGRWKFRDSVTVVYSIDDPEVSKLLIE